MMKRIKIRVDASSEIGYGHLTRCCALLNSITEIHAYFYSTEPIEQSLNQLCLTHFSFIHLANNEDFIEHVTENDILLIDGYNFDSTYLTKLKLKGSKVIYIDDLAHQYLPVDVIINPTPGFTANSYSSLLATQYFLGLDFALLRSSFQELANKQRSAKIENSLLICFGGSDPLNKTAIAYKAAIDSMRFSEIHIVLGQGYIHEFNIENGSITSTIYTALPEQEMANLMRKMDYGIVPTSGILLECLAAKINVISGYYIENQKFVYAEHLKLGNFTDASNLSYESILSSILKLKKNEWKNISIDGKSTIRLSKIISSVQSEEKYSIRFATSSDLEITYQWANHQLIRKFAFNQEFIPYEVHQNWFISKITSKECFYFLLTKEEKPIGSIRFDVTGSIATISYLLAPEIHGKGLGAVLMKKGLEELEKIIQSNRIEIVQGWVLQDNIASIKLFKRFGFFQETESNMYLFKKNTSLHV